ncbi:MAG: SUMF1/EgtB/PvdO family nonheme iron enzyme [Cyclobacteriaceae bacterium]
MGENPSNFKGSNLPVESVSWLDAITFCNKLSEQTGLHSSYAFNDENDEVIYLESANGYRLPTEAEWQYACQANSKSISSGDLDKIA